jgi:gas vesicle protein
MGRFLSFVSGAMLGALVGAVTALLLAPMPGEELQRRARERIEAIRDEVREAYEARLAQLEAELEALRRGRKEPTEA